MAYIKQGFKDKIVDENGNVTQEGTVLKAEHLINIEDGILENAKNIELASGNTEPLVITGDDFTDGLYYYGSVGSAVSSISNSSKMAGYEKVISVREGQKVTIKIYTNATVGYLLADDDNIIVNSNSPTGTVVEVVVPSGVTKLYVNTLKTEKANSSVNLESSNAQTTRQVNELIKSGGKKMQFEPTFDLSKVPNYEIPAKSTIMAAKLDDIYSQYDELVSKYPSYVTKIDCDADVQTALGITKPSQLDGLPIYLYKFSPTRAKNSGGNDTGSRKKVFITSMHPQEKLGVWVTAKTLTMICENWKQDYNAELLRSLIDIYVMPLAWPWNADNNSRKNYNGVNPNRNFPTKSWYETGNGGQDYTGPSAASEYETQVIVYYFNQIKPDVTIDVHTSGHDNNGCMGIILCPNNNQSFVDLCGVITRTTSNAAIRENPTFALNDPDSGGLYGVYPEASPPPGEFYQWASEQGYGVALLTEESPYCNWQDGIFLGADGKFVEEYTPGIFRQQIQYLFNCILRLTKYQC